MSRKIFNYCLLFSAIAPGLYAKDLDTIYFVKKNDTLSAIAKKFKITVEDILKVNNIANPNFIYPGMKLRITKPKAEEPIPETVTLSDKETITKDYEVYIVKKDDTLNKIAKKFETTVEAIVKNNDIKNPNFIYPGQKLKIVFEKKIFKIEVAPNSYVEIYYKGEILGYKNIKGKEVLNVKGDQVKTGEEFNVKVYDNKGDIEEKKVTISSKPVTFITFIDKNNNGQLDIDDELLTDGSLKIKNKNVAIDNSGRAVVNDLESEQTYDIILTAKDKNIINKKFNMKINDEIVYIPIKSNLFSIKGSVNISGNGDLKQIYDDLLIRLKNENGDEVSLFLVDENGEFLIEELPPGKYLYDVEYVTPSIIKNVIKNKEIEINGKTFEIPLKLKRNGTL